MAYKKTVILFRPWLTGAVMERLAVPHLLHCDAKAYLTPSGDYALTIDLSWSGQHLAGRSVYVRDWITGDWIEREDVELGKLVYWCPDHDLRALHKAALNIRDALPDIGQSRVSFLAHYIRCIDVDPWPRGMVNTWRYDRKK